jgi:bifunctional non-homologous end joining protein LigD
MPKFAGSTFSRCLAHQSLNAGPQDPRHFIDPILLLRTERLPTGSQWVYELKFDSYRAEAIKTDGKVHLRSRNDEDFKAGTHPSFRALAMMPDGTVIDGDGLCRPPGER